MIDLVDAMNSSHDENGEPVYPDQEMSDAVNLALPKPGDPVILHDLACTASHDGQCSTGCEFVGIKQTDQWDEPTEEHP